MWWTCAPRVGCLVASFKGMLWQEVGYDGAHVAKITAKVWISTWQSKLNFYVHG